MNNFYTYAYLREDGTPYYIGKGRGYRINHKRHSVKLPPKSRRVVLKNNLTEEEAFRHEEYMIYLFGRKDLGTGILRNMTFGGEGTSGIIRSTDHMNALHEGRKKIYTKEHSEKISKTLKEKGIIPPSQKGKKWWYNDGNECLSLECPGKEWKLGRPSSAKRWRENNPQWTDKKLSHNP
jgi:hypothetical protein